MASTRIRSRTARALFSVVWVALGAFLFDRVRGGGGINVIGALWPPYIVATLAWALGVLSDTWLAPLTASIARRRPGLVGEDRRPDNPENRRQTA